MRLSASNWTGLELFAGFSGQAEWQTILPSRFENSERKTDARRFPPRTFCGVMVQEAVVSESQYIRHGIKSWLLPRKILRSGEGPVGVTVAGMAADG